MPYPTIDDLPPILRARLPHHAQEIYRAAFNHAWDGYGRCNSRRREEIAHRVAWAAVKTKYHKGRRSLGLTSRASTGAPACGASLIRIKAP
ncbi:ChaB family protein [Labrys sedimenti]|uniref:ChaB family protein n=1 Tax=Labrys sedimenti TaxID=3106036 RepID=UPI002ACAF381|nr:ChaB family protein [Labrys sp. ZIDIC5]MDZ5454502.1 ChaB family protein [Labrys sp. ZIDIC5]